MATATAAPEKKKVEKVLTFKWEGTNKRGDTVKGEIKAGSEKEARQLLAPQGVNITKMKQVSTLLKRKPKVTTADIAVLSRQLATMMESGVPLVQAFDIVGKGHENPAMQKMIMQIKQDIEGGLSTSAAMAKHPKHFDDLFVNLVRSGEQAGILDDLLDKIATYKEKTESVKKKIKKALIYPAAVIGVAFLITAIIMIFVVPKFDEMFKSFGSELPAFTQVVVAMSEYFVAYWWLIFGGIAGGIFMLKRALANSKALRDKKDALMLKLPVVGDILNKAALARFCRTTATMFAAGVPLVEALTSVSKATGNAVYENIVISMRDEVETGTSLKIAMAQHSIFPHLMNQMVAIGEESGSLDKMLGKVADFYEEEVDNAVDSMSSLMEPLIMVVLGTIVGGLVVALYLPIFQMGKTVM